MKNLIIFLWISILGIPHSFAQTDGRWRLTISGQDQIEFGTEHLAGGLHINWQTDLEFSISQGQFTQGTGSAKLDPEVTTFSRPEDMFDCHQVIGSFVSSSGISFSTPHLRFQAFPMTGKVINGKVQLNPFLEYPGNYYAVLYECQTQDSLGSFWLENSPRIARELSKRQDAMLKSDDKTYQASIKQVKNIAPGPEIIIPLQDGYELSLTQEYGLRKLHYQLKRIANE